MLCRRKRTITRFLSGGHPPGRFRTRAQPTGKETADVYLVNYTHVFSPDVDQRIRVLLREIRE